MIFLYRVSTLLDFHAVWKLFMIPGVNRETNEPVLMMMMGAALPCRKALLSYRVSILLQYKNLSASLMIIAAQDEKKKQQLQVARFYTLQKLCTTLGRLPCPSDFLSTWWTSRHAMYRFLLNTSTEFLLFSSVSEVVWTCAFGRTFLVSCSTALSIWSYCCLACSSWKLESSSYLLMICIHITTWNDHRERIA